MPLEAQAQPQRRRWPSESLLVPRQYHVRSAHGTQQWWGMAHPWLRQERLQHLKLLPRAPPGRMQEVNTGLPRVTWTETQHV